MVLWRNMEICRLATPTPFNDLQWLAQLFITKVFRFHVPTKFCISRKIVRRGLLSWNSVGALWSQFPTPNSENHIRYLFLSLVMCVPSFVRFWASLAPQKQLPVSWRIMRRHGNSVQWKLTVFTMNHHQGLKVLLTKFEVDMINLLGVVSSNIALVTSCRQ